MSTLFWVFLIGIVLFAKVANIMNVDISTIIDFLTCLKAVCVKTKKRKHGFKFDIRLTIRYSKNSFRDKNKA